LVAAAPAGAGITATTSVEMTMIIRLTTVYVDGLRQSHEWRSAAGKDRLFSSAVSRWSEISSCRELHACATVAIRYWPCVIRSSSRWCGHASMLLALWVLSLQCGTLLWFISWDNWARRWNQCFVW